LCACSCLAGRRATPAVDLRALDVICRRGVWRPHRSSRVFSAGMDAAPPVTPNVPWTVTRTRSCIETFTSICRRLGSMPAIAAKARAGRGHRRGAAGSPQAFAPLQRHSGWGW
jgi:hypothetical protein